MKVDISSILQGDGGQQTFSHALSLEALDPRFSEVSAEGVLKNIAGAVTVRACVRGVFTGECDRCLDPVRVPLTAQIDTVLTRDGSKDESVAIENGVIDLDRTAYEALSLLIPMITLCEPACKGLCPGCGANLNREPCKCS